MDQFGHEKLNVYQKAVAFVACACELLPGMKPRPAVYDHLHRASESIIESIATGNSLWSAGQRNRHFDVAYGSGLECAACLDVCAAKNLITVEQAASAKSELRDIVRMVVGLRRSQDAEVGEEPAEYRTSGAPQSFPIYFNHERLDVYQKALELVAWVDSLLAVSDLDARHASRLDKASTSVVLDIAEGNGRFEQLDHRRFIDIAHTSALQAASCLDILVARKRLEAESVGRGKHLLLRVVSMLMGMRRYLDTQP